MFTIAIHGGAGLSTPEDLGPEREEQARIDLHALYNQPTVFFQRGVKR